MPEIKEQEQKEQLSEQIYVDTLVEVLVTKGVYDDLKAQAKKNNTDIATTIRRKLLQFGHVDSTKPIVLNDADRQHVEKLLARNLTTADELVSALQRALMVRVDSIEIPISPFLLDRLRTRCIGMEFDKFMQQTIKRALEEFAGVR